MTKANISVIGAGNWGKNLIRVCHELGVLASICDNNLQKAKVIAEGYNVRTQTWQEVLHDNTVNAVIIALPANLHEKYIAEALEVNKHVFVEKPLAMDKTVAQNLAVLSQKKSRVLMVGHILQYHNAYIALKELIDEGAIGSIRYVESNRLHMGPVRYDAGIIWELLPHDVSMLLGVCKSNVKTLAVAQQNFYNQQIKNPFFSDVINVDIEFINGIHAKLYSSWLHPQKEQKFWVAGTKGMLLFTDTENWDSKLKLFKYNNQEDYLNGINLSLVSEQKITLTPLEPLKAEINQFVCAVEKNSSVITDAVEGVKIVNLLYEIESKLKIQQAHSMSMA